MKTREVCKYTRVPAERGQKNQAADTRRVAVGEREGSRSAKRFSAHKGRRVRVWVRIQNGQGAFRKTLDAAIHRVETVIERQDTHARKQPWRRRPHHGWIAIQAGDHQHALPQGWRRSIGRARAHASLYSIPSQWPTTDGPRFLRRMAAIRADMRCGLAVPVLAGRRTRGGAGVLRAAGLPRGFSSADGRRQCRAARGADPSHAGRGSAQWASLHTLGHTGGPLQRIDTSAPLDQVVNDFGASIQETHAHVTRDALPVVSADARQLTLKARALASRSARRSSSATAGVSG